MLFRGVVGVVVGRHRVRGLTGLLGELDLDIAVAVDTGTGRDPLRPNRTFSRAPMSSGGTRGPYWGRPALQTG